MAKVGVFITFLFITSSVFGQAIQVLTDDFSDGDFQNPTWTGNVSHFLIENETLRLNAPEAGRSQINLNHGISSGIWQLSVDMRFAPSGSNKLEFYWTDRLFQPGEEGNGYMLTVGESGSGDVFEFYRVANGARTTKLIEDTLSIANGGEYVLRLVRSNSFEWSLGVVNGWNNEVVGRMIATDSSTVLLDWFSIVPIYTSTRTTEFYFDDLAFSKEPLSITSSEVLSNDQLVLRWNEGITLDQIQSAQFELSKEGAVLNLDRVVTSVAPNELIITFEPPLESGRYDVRVSGMKDKYGFDMLPFTSSFSIFEEYVEGDIVLSEFCYDPPSEWEEFVELRNVSQKQLTLSKWKLSDNGQTRYEIPNTTINAGEYVVLSKDTTGLFTVFGDQNYVQLSRGPTLNNTTPDQVRIFDHLDRVVDSLEYSPNWGGRNGSLERRAVDVAAEFKENWGASPAPKSATPGEPNLIEKDVRPPELLALFVSSAQQLTLVFSERIQKETAERASVFTIRPDLPLSSLTLTAPDTLLIEFAEELVENRTYELTADGITDIFGNVAPPLVRSFVRITQKDAFWGAVSINEFMYDPPDEYSEYIEVVNADENSWDLKEWAIRDNRDSFNTLTSVSTPLLPGEYLVIAPDSSLRSIFGDIPLLVLGSRFPALNNSGDQIRLYDSKRTLIDSLTYTSEWGGRDVALERRSTELPADWASNWGNSPAELLGTPGGDNEIALDESPPEVLEVTVKDQQTIVFVFSEPIVFPSVENETLASIENISIASIQIQGVDSVVVGTENPLPENTEISVELRGVKDVFGNEMVPFQTVIQFVQTGVPKVGSVRVNEFMYDPPSGYSEYIELINPTSQVFDLKDWRVNDSSGSPAVITPESYLLLPNAYVVIAPDSSIITSFGNIPLITMGSRFSSLNNAGDEIKLYAPNNLRIDSLRYTSSWGGNDVALERRKVEVASTFQENWGNSESPLFGTPGAENQVAEDLTAPSISNISVISSEEMELLFSERLLQDVTSDPGNYELQSGRAIQSVAFYPPDTVRITLQAPLEPNTVDTITVGRLVDIFGNERLSVSHEFLFVVPAIPSYGSVVISEFMYDPGDNYTEFIELYNASDSLFNLKEWTWSDNSGVPQIITTKDVIFQPHTYLVLAPSNQLSLLFPTITVIEPQVFSSLNNSSDAIVIRSNKGVLLDSLRYQSAWGGNDVSLERRSFSALSTSASNWGDSPNPARSTAGRENEILPDITPPVLLSSNIYPDSAVFLFDEPVFILSDSHISIFPYYPFQWDVQEGRLLLVFSSALQEAVMYRFSLENVEDIFGNSASFDISQELLFGEPPQFFEVVVNEFLPVSTEEQPEFIELLNTSRTLLDINEMSIQDTRETVLITTASVGGELPVLRPDSIVVLSSDAVFVSQTPNAILVEKLPLLNNDADSILIRIRGQLTDAVYYSRDWNVIEAGQSYERKDPLNASSDPGNWSASFMGHSAGRKNRSFEIDQTPPYIRYAWERSKDTVEMVLSEFLAPGTLPDLSLDGSTLLVEATEDPTRYLSVIQLDEDISNVIQVNLLEDFKGNALTDQQSEILRMPKEGSILVTEVMYDPFNEPERRQSEYIEVKNVSPISLWIPPTFIKNYSTTTQRFTNLGIETDSIIVLHPQTFAVIYADTSQFDESRLATFFDLTDSQSFHRVNRTTLSLSSSTTTILLSHQGVITDSVAYSEDFHNPNVFDTKGRSLERISVSGSSSLRQNWSTNANDLGGTPGIENTVALDRSDERKEAISITPNPFSPDEDGFDDHTMISWKFDEPDFLLDILIYDRYGRKIIDLVKSLPAGVSGEMAWDGFTQDGKRTRIGIYIVLVKAYNSANGTDTSFKKTVVVAKKL